MSVCLKHNRAPDVSMELTEVRTVMSRAESALAQLGRGWRRSDDADAELMKASLNKVVAELDRWRKCRSDCEGRRP